MADWQAIKAEYITTDTSYRKLAKKYGLNYNTISERGKSEDWVEERNQYRAKTHSEIIDAIGDQQVDRAARIRTVADELLDKIEFMVEGADLTAKDVRALVASIKDLKEIQGVKSELDRREQEARIANLQKQAEKDDDQINAPTLVITGLPEEFKV